MGVLADWQIEQEQCVAPFETAQKKPGVITWGASSYGYDIRLSPNEFKVFSPVHAGGKLIDPKNFPKCILDSPRAGEPWVIPGNSFALGVSEECFNIPRSCIGIVLGKSSYARCGLVINITPLEPEWRGHVTMEMSNTTPLPMLVYPGEGIAQVVFHRADGYTQAILDVLTDLADVTEKAILTRSDVLATRIGRKLCRTSYADKGGRYQDQAKSATLPCVIGQEVRTLAE